MTTDVRHGFSPDDQNESRHENCPEEAGNQDACLGRTEAWLGELNPKDLEASWEVVDSVAGTP